MYNREVFLSSVKDLSSSEGTKKNKIKKNKRFERNQKIVCKTVKECKNKFDIMLWNTGLHRFTNAN